MNKTIKLLVMEIQTIIYESLMDLNNILVFTTKITLEMTLSENQWKNYKMQIF